MNTNPRNRAKTPSQTRVTTLVVDDSPFMLKILAQILEKTGNFDLVGTAPDGWQALRQVRALSPELVLTDFHMPHLNGIQATQYIKQREHSPVVIIVSSDDSPGSRSMAEKAGADGFVSKAGNLGFRLTRTLQDIFGPCAARRAAAESISFQDGPAHSNQEHGK